MGTSGKLRVLSQAGQDASKPRKQASNSVALNHATRRSSPAKGGLMCMRKGKPD
jgi:hypothetical protein